MNKSNKTIAGYHLLMIMSTVDETFHADADQIIREFLSKESPFKLNLDDELDKIINLSKEKAEEHFIKKAKDFYDDSNAEERDEFKEFAKKLLRADNEVSAKENDAYRTLLKTWKKQSM